ASLPVPTVDGLLSVDGEAAFGALLQSLYADAPGTRVTALLESAHMPALLIDVGDQFMGRRQAMALLRHRLAMLFEKAGASADAWDVRTDHVAGDRIALGYGVRASLRKTLLAACDSAGIQCKAL